MLHLYGEGGELSNSLTQLLHIPVANILLLQLLGELSDVHTSGDLVAAFHIALDEDYVVLIAHVIEAEVHRRAVRSGKQHELSHDAWDIQLLPHSPRVTFRTFSVSILTL
jgi:hypothetical protein